MKRGAEAISPDEVDGNYPRIPSGMIQRCNELIRQHMSRGVASFYYESFGTEFGPFDADVIQLLVEQYFAKGWVVIYPTANAKQQFRFEKPKKNNWITPPRQGDNVACAM